MIAHFNVFFCLGAAGIAAIGADIGGGGAGGGDPGGGAMGGGVAAAGGGAAAGGAAAGVAPGGACAPASLFGAPQLVQKWLPAGISLPHSLQNMAPPGRYLSVLRYRSAGEQKRAAHFNPLTRHTGL
jgi:hypothetical protein